MNQFRPKGSMCTACVHAERDCSSLPFDAMPRIGRDPDGVAVVACVEYSGK